MAKTPDVAVNMEGKTGLQLNWNLPIGNWGTAEGAADAAPMDGLGSCSRSNNRCIVHGTNLQLGVRGESSADDITSQSG